VLGGVEDAGLKEALRDLLFAGECLVGLEAAYVGDPGLVQVAHCRKRAKRGVE